MLPFVYFFFLNVHFSPTLAATAEIQSPPALSRMDKVTFEKILSCL